MENTHCFSRFLRNFGAQNTLFKSFMLVRLIISALSVAAAAFFIDGVTVEPWWASIVVAVVYGLINALVRPVVKLFALPVNILTLGLFTFVINALMVLLCAWFIPQYFKVASFLDALYFSIIVAIVSWLLGLFAPKN
ncbi:MAG: phage holin family protein [Muribaculaceae bacterium]|nr:phage holin family protein [Muribaculaceae bacterium]